MAVAESTKKLQRERILRGQCPLCGEEAAPYRLCYSHRFRQRLDRSLKRGEKLQTLKSFGTSGNKTWWLGDKHDDPDANRLARRWATPIHLPETDGRTKPRLRNIPIDVEKTLMDVIRFIGRPCSAEEIIGAWGKLRDRRSSPLSHDLGRILKAVDRRNRRLQKALKHSNAQAAQ